MSDLDAARYPRAARYLAALPSGLASFPECTVNYHVHEHVRTDFPALGVEPPLPGLLGDFFAKRLSGGWFPEVVGNVIYLMVRDAAFETDEQFLAWNTKNVQRLFSNPLYRALMALLSTSLIVMGTSKRWSAFHLGTSMQASPIVTVHERFNARARLTFPPGLFDDLLLLQHCSTYRAALAAAHAKDPGVDLVDRGEGFADYVASWAK